MSTSSNKVFISYSGDRADREHLVVALKEAGVRPWRDVEDLPAGASTRDTIERELTRCTAAILWINEWALSSDYIRDIEAPLINEAIATRGIQVVPVADGLGIGEALRKFQDSTGYAFSDHNGYELDTTLRPEIEAGTIASWYVTSHVSKAAEAGADPVVRFVTRDDTATHAAEATLNFDWRHLFGDTGQDDSRLRKAFGLFSQSTKALLEAFRPGEVTVAAKTHLPVGFAIGHAFRRTTGAHPVMNAHGSQWRPTNDPTTPADPLRESVLPADTASDRAALEIHVSRDITTAVRDTMRSTGRSYRRHVRLAPADGPSQWALSSNAQANAWARQIQEVLERLSCEPNVRHVDLYYAGTIELAVLIGTWLNAFGAVTVHDFDKGNGVYRPMWTIPAT